MDDCCCLDCTPNDYMRGICSSNGCQYHDDYCWNPAPAYWDCIEICSGSDAPTAGPTQPAPTTASPTTAGPTNSPSLDPTASPSSEPTIRPSDAPSSKATTFGATTMSDELNAAETTATTEPQQITDSLSSTEAVSGPGDEFMDWDQIRINKELFVSVAVAISAAFTLTLCVALIDSKVLRSNDFFRPQALILAMFQELDLLSDAFFAFHLSSYFAKHHLYRTLFVLSMICIVVPILVAMLQLIVQIQRSWWREDTLKIWLSQYAKSLYFFSVFTGSAFTAVELMSSNLFGLEMFSFDLTNRAKLRFKMKRVYSIVMLENVPQLCIQGVFLWNEGISDVIAVSSAIFSAVSIIVAVTSVVTEKQILDGSGYAAVALTVSGPEIVAKAYSFRMRVLRIRDQLASVLGLPSPQIIEMEKPKVVPGGLRLSFFVHLNHINSRDIDYRAILKESIESLRLNRIIGSCWGMQQTPTVSDFTFTAEESLDRKKNTVAIRVQSVASEEGMATEQEVGRRTFSESMPSEIAGPPTVALPPRRRKDVPEFTPMGGSECGSPPELEGHTATGNVPRPDDEEVGDFEVVYSKEIGTPPNDGDEFYGRNSVTRR